MHARGWLRWTLAILPFCVAASAWGDQLADHESTRSQSTDSTSLRVATFNVSLYGDRSGEVARRLSSHSDLQARKIAAVVQTVRPDVLLVNEIDFDSESSAAKLLRDHYFAVGEEGREGIDYPYFFGVPSNTGVDSGLDLDRNQRNGDPADAWGYGAYPGQYAMAVFSRFPIDTAAIRTFQQFKWAELPGALRPTDPSTGESYYSDDVWQKLRLSSKNHIDVPIRVGDQTLHLLASHPTPPVFDGPEDRNGCRNHDEIVFWTHYLSDAEFLSDDNGIQGGLDSQSQFVLLGDLNSDPVNGEGRREGIRKLLQHPRLIDSQPIRTGHRSVDSAKIPEPGDYRKSHPALDTADFGRVGTMRVDFVLPSSNTQLVRARVFWPSPESPEAKWLDASDHHLVWVDIHLQSR